MQSLKSPHAKAPQTPNPVGPLLPKVQSLAQATRAGDWHLQLLHCSDHPLLYWITRGQGRALVQGVRTGVGAHNAIFVPAGCLHALDLSKQSIGLVLHFPAHGPGFDQCAQHLPKTPCHLRINDGAKQGELTALLDALAREQASPNPLKDPAMQAWATLAALWLARHQPPPTGSTKAGQGILRPFGPANQRQPIDGRFCRAAGRDTHAFDPLLQTNRGHDRSRNANPSRALCGAPDD